MIIQPGNYVGTGYYYTENKGSKLPIECTIVVDTRGQHCKVTGHWGTYSNGNKNSITVVIEKIKKSEVNPTTIELPNYSLNGKLFSLDKVVNGVFSSEYRTEILGVTLFESNKRLNLAGSLQGGKNSHFKVELLDAEPDKRNSNVVSLSDRA